MQHSKKEIKELRKYALKLSDIPKLKDKLQALILLLIGIFCIVYLISTGRSFVKSWLIASKETISKIRVEVLNGTNRAGLAKRTANFLRSKGFDIIGYEDANREVESTVILDRINPSLESASFVRRALRQGKVSFEPHPLQLLEVTVVLGNDFKEIKEIKRASSLLYPK
ncbi:MAG: LytR C-terminal domain-containing protein [bacterium]|nr:LytR C-terminal domain-containing protein [bacterium]